MKSASELIDIFFMKIIFVVCTTFFMKLNFEVLPPFLRKPLFFYRLRGLKIGKNTAKNLQVRYFSEEIVETPREKCRVLRCFQDFSR